MMVADVPEPAVVDAARVDVLVEAVEPAPGVEPVELPSGFAEPTSGVFVATDAFVVAPIFVLAPECQA